MCMEDLKIGRNTQSSQMDLTTSVASQQALSYDPKRTAIILGSPSSDAVFFGLGNTAISGFGIRIAAGQPPVQLTLESHGEMVRQGWSVIASAATPTVSVFTTSYPFGDDKPKAPQ